MPRAAISAKVPSLADRAKSELEDTAAANPLFNSDQLARAQPHLKSVGMQACQVLKSEGEQSDNRDIVA